MKSSDSPPARFWPVFRGFTLFAFIALIVFGCVLRFWKLADVGLWYDELWTVVGASNRPFMEMYREWILGDAHPPGYFLFYFAWLKIVPNTEFWARVPNAIAGVITVAYLLVRPTRVLTRDERIMSASFAALSYIYIFYALSVKQYSAMILFATIATIAYLEIVTARCVDRRRGATLAAACLALAYLNHFGMVYAAMLLTLLAATFRRDREPLRRIGRVSLVCGLGYLPISYFLYIQLRYSIDSWQPYQIRAFLSEVMPSLFFDDAASVYGALGLLALVLIVRGIGGGQTRQLLATDRNRHLLLVIALFVGFMLALGTAEPVFFVRYFLVIVPALFLGLGIATAAAFPLEEGWLAVLPLAFFVHGAVVQFHSIDTLQRQQWDKSVDFVLKAKTPTDRIYVLGAGTDKTEFDYLKAGDVDGVFYVRNLKFYKYYFRRRGAPAVAAKLEVVLPTIDSVRTLAARFHNTGTTIYVLAGHHIQYDGDALAALKRATRQLVITRMNGTLVYKLIFW